MNKKLVLLALTGVTLLAASCNNGSVQRQSSDSTQTTAQIKDSANGKYPPGTFGYDLDFLKQYDSVILLRNGKAVVIVSPKYQRKVFTSTANGLEGQSFGWINYKAFSGAVDAHMNAYGGENRLWLGPEGGKFSLFFDKGSAMQFQNWKTPAAFDTDSWREHAYIVDSQTVGFVQDMRLLNYSGTPLNIEIQRGIYLLNDRRIDSLLHLASDTAVSGVGYETMNAVTNMGKVTWTATTGMPCIWLLDMFRPSPQTTIIVPYKEEVKDKTGKIATTDYFGEIPADRINYSKGVLLFRADGKKRGKLGLSPLRARSMAGSYDAQNKILTIILFEKDSSGKYLNQEWNTIKPSFSGDAVNAYNDGPLADGSQMGPFYELESVSPAAFLAPGRSLIHHHWVFHFTGEEPGLDKISRQTLGISLEEVKKAF